MPHVATNVCASRDAMRCTAVQPTKVEAFKSIPQCIAISKLFLDENIVQQHYEIVPRRIHVGAVFLSFFFSLLFDNSTDHRTSQNRHTITPNTRAKLRTTNIENMKAKRNHATNKRHSRNSEKRRQQQPAKKKCDTKRFFAEDESCEPLTRHTEATRHANPFTFSLRKKNKNGNDNKKKREKKNEEKRNRKSDRDMKMGKEKSGFNK